MGNATLSFEGMVDVKGKPAYLIIFKADGPKFYDEEKIHLDPQTFTPILVLRDLNLLGKEKITEEYFPEEGRILITKTASGKTTQEEIKKGGQIDNIYGVIYRYRAFGSFKVNDGVQLRLPTRDVALKIEKSMTMKAGGQVYDAFHMSSVPSMYQIWFDASPQKIPLRIRGPLGKMNSTMFMKRYKPGQ